MIVNPYKNSLIALEGIDGCGKGAVMAALRTHFGERAIFTAEPTDSSYGKKFRFVLDNKGKDEGGRQLSWEEIQLLCVRDRGYHRAYEKDWLRTRPVITDRDWYSACAYGGGVADIIRMHEDISYEMGGDFFIPDLAIVIDITPEEAVRRQIAQGKKFDHFEYDIKKREKIRLAYLALPETLKKLDPEVSFNIRIVDGMRSEQEVFADVLTLVREVFRQKTGQEL